MKLPIFNAAALAALCAGLLPGADPQLLSLVMPDAKVLAGINVDQAKTTPFGRYVLSQLEAQGAQHLQQIATLTGFDPTRDLTELLIASNGTPGSRTGLILARGNFNPAQIQGAAQAGGGTTVAYAGVTLVLDPKQANAVAFLDSTLAVAGDVASVKAAIDRQRIPAPLDASVTANVNQWSSNEDAWVIGAAPFELIRPNPTNAQNAAVQNVVQNIQQAGGGVKFADPIVFTAQAQTDTAANANALAGVVQFLANMAPLQAPQANPELASILGSLSVAASGNSVNLSLQVSEQQAEQIVKLNPPATAPQQNRRAPRRRL